MEETQSSAPGGPTDDLLGGETPLTPLTVTPLQQILIKCFFAVFAKSFYVGRELEMFYAFLRNWAVSNGGDAFVKLMTQTWQDWLN